MSSDEWAAQLKHELVAVRREAMQSLIQLLPESKSALPQVTSALEDSDAEVRSSAALFLQFVGPEAKGVVAKLANLLADEHRKVREQAQQALHKIGWTPDAVPGIIRAVQAGTDTWVALKLADLGPAADREQAVLLECLQSLDPQVRLGGLRGLRAISARDVAAAVIPFVEDRDEQTRAEAVHLLGSMGGNAAQAVPTLRLIPLDLDPALDGPANVREAETSHLVAWARIAPRDEDLVPTLLRVIQTDDGPHRFNAYLATVALGHAAVASEQARRELVKLLQHRDPRVARTAAIVCGRVGEVMVPLLDEALASEQADQAAHANTQIAQALVAIPSSLRSTERLARVLREPEALGTLLEQLRSPQPPADLASPLMEALDHRDTDVRLVAIVCMREIKPPAVAAVPKLLSLLNDPFPQVRISAAEALVTIQPSRGAAAVAELLEALDGGGQPRGAEFLEVPTAQLPAVRHLAVIAAQDAEVANALGEMLKTADPPLRQTIIAALGETNEDATPIALRMLRDRRQEVRLQALELLARAGPAAKPAVPQLIDYLQSDDQRTRRLALNALAGIGPEAAPAVPALLAMARGHSLEDSAAEFALVRIGKPAVPGVAKLLEEGRSSDQEQEIALRVLAGIGPDAKEALPALAALGKAVPSSQLDQWRRGSIARAILAVVAPPVAARPEANVEVSPVGMLFGHDRQPPPRRPPAEAVELLIALLPDEQAAAVLVAHPDVVGPHLARVLEVLKRTKAGSRAAMLRVVAAQGEHAREAVPVLRTLMREGAADSGEAAIALALVGGEQAMDDLLGLLKRPADLPQVDGLKLDPANARSAAAINRVHALKALGHIRTGVERFVPNLVHSLHDTDPDIRRTAADALQRLPLFRIEKAAKAALADLPAPPPSADRLYEVRALRERLEPREVREEFDMWRPRRSPPPPANAAESVVLTLAAIERLSAVDDSVRMEATSELKRCIRLPPLGEARPALVCALGKPPPEVFRYSASQDPRMAAAELLGRYGAEARDALPDLVELARLNPLLPQALAEHVAAIGPPAVPVMAALLGDRDRSVRQLAAWALARLGPVARSAEPAIMRSYWEVDEEDLTLHSRMIAAIGISQLAVNELLAKVKGPDASAQSRSRAALAALAGSDARVQDGLYDLLASEHPPSAFFAARTLVQVNFGRRPQASRQTVERIGRLMVTNPQVPAELDDGVGHKGIAIYAAAALIGLGPDAEPALAPLLEALKSANREVQLAAVQVLGSIGPPARAALPQLAAVLKQLRTPAPRGDFFREEFRYRGRDTPASTVAAALVRIGGADSAAAIAQALDDPDPQTRQFVYARLVGWGRESMPAMQSLVAALSSPRPDVRNAAAHVLAGIGPDAAGAVPQLAERLQDDRIYIRKSAALALGRIGPAARTAEPALQQLKEERLTCLRAAAEQALRDIQ